MPALTLTALAAAVRDTYVGYWSPYALLLAIFMAFTGLILLVVFIIYALMGRISPRVKPREEFAHMPGDEDEEDMPSMDVALKRSQKTALRKAAKAEAKAEPEKKTPRRDTGWQYILGALGCSIISPMVFSWIDNPMGRMRGFTFGTVLTLLLFALQIFLTVRFALRQRRLPR